MTDVMTFAGGYIAVGGDFFNTGLMTAWTSPDGKTWSRSPHPPEETDPSVAQMTAEAVTTAAGSIWAAGRDFDARRDAGDGLPAMWNSTDGITWTRVALRRNKRHCALHGDQHSRPPHRSMATTVQPQPGPRTDLRGRLANKSRRRLARRSLEPFEPTHHPE